MLKKVLKQYFRNKNNKYFIFVFVIVVIIRFLYLDKIPVGYAHDEVGYILSGKSYALNGRDISGYSFPLSLFRSETEGRASAIPSIILSAYFSFVEVNHATARIPYVLINILTALVIFIFVKKLFKNKQIALVALVVFLINPWSFYYSRWATDSAFALLFFVSGITLFLSENSKVRYLSLLSLVLGFFSYHGAKPVFLFVVIVLVIYSLLIKKDNKSFSFPIKFSLLAFVFLALYIFIEINIPGIEDSGRYGELIFTDKQYIEKIVNTERRVVISNPFVNIFSNKATVLFKTFIGKYLQAFSPQTLFISGDLRATYRFENHGLFYYIDILLIPVGIGWAWIKKKKEALLLIMLLVVSPISTAINTVKTSVINRSFLLLPVFVVFISAGIIAIHNFLRKKIGSKLSLATLIFIITFSFVNFLYFYFFRYPVASQENLFLSERVLANYLTHADDKKNRIYVITREHRMAVLESIFYSDQETQEDKLSGIYKEPDLEREYFIDQIVFKRDCPDELIENNTYIIHRNAQCFENEKYDSIIQNQKDAGLVFRIYNDYICNDYNLTPWRREHLLSDYAIEKLSKDIFCQRWINI